MELARLGDAQKKEKVVGGLCKERAGYLPLHSDVTQGTFCRIVLPRDTVFVEKREQRVSIALKAFLEFDGDFGGVGCAHNALLVEAFD